MVVNQQSRNVSHLAACMTRPIDQKMLSSPLLEWVCRASPTQSSRRHRKSGDAQNMSTSGRMKYCKTSKTVRVAGIWPDYFVIVARIRRYYVEQCAYCHGRGGFFFLTCGAAVSQNRSLSVCVCVCLCGFPFPKWLRMEIDISRE